MDEGKSRMKTDELAVVFFCELSSRELEKSKWMNETA